MSFSWCRTNDQTEMVNSFLLCMLSPVRRAKLCGGVGNHARQCLDLDAEDMSLFSNLLALGSRFAVRGPGHVLRVRDAKNLELCCRIAQPLGRRVCALATHGGERETRRESGAVRERGRSCSCSGSLSAAAGESSRQQQGVGGQPPTADGLPPPVRLGCTRSGAAAQGPLPSRDWSCFNAGG